MITRTLLTETSKKPIATISFLYYLLLRLPANTSSAVVSNAGEIRADPLQRLHTLHNLAALLGPAGDGVQGVSRTLRDDQLKVLSPLRPMPTRSYQFNATYPLCLVPYIIYPLICSYLFMLISSCLTHWVALLSVLLEPLALKHKGCKTNISIDLEHLKVSTPRAGPPC